MLSSDAAWNDLGPDYFDRRQSSEQRAYRRLAELRSLGWGVRANDDGTTTLVPPAA